MTTWKQRWEWEGDGGKWSVYSKMHNQKIDDAIKAGRKTVTLALPDNKTKLDLNFNKMEQKNSTTGWKRRIRFSVAIDSDETYHFWEWEDDNKLWQPCAQEMGSLLEKSRDDWVKAKDEAGNNRNSDANATNDATSSCNSTNDATSNNAKNDANGTNASDNAATSSSNANSNGNANSNTNDTASATNSVQSCSSVISLWAAGRKYEVDFETMTQRNVDTNKERALRRIQSNAVLPAQDDSAAPSQSSTASSISNNAGATAAGRSLRARNKNSAAAAVSDSEDEESQPRGRLTRSASKRSTGTAAAGSSRSRKSAAADDDNDDEPVNKRVRKSAAEERKSKSAGADNSEEGTVKTVVVKGRAPVDPECTSRVNSAHVYCEGNDIYDVMLNQTNIHNNNNKFYLIQLLEDDTRKAYSVWFRWGRVGARGQSSLESYGSNLDGAKNSFCRKFSDKTKNDWSDRKNFKKVAGKYDMVKLDYSSKSNNSNSKSESSAKADAAIPESKLNEKLQALIKLICDVKEMEDLVMEMKYDANKAPLGRLTEDQIKAGYAALKKIDALINKNDFGPKLTESCNEFYTRIPHDFKMSRPPIIRTTADVKKKLELLEALGDIEIAMRLLQEAKSTENPIDAHYKSLNCDLKVMEHSDPTFKLISDYLINTHAPTHNQYKMKVLDVFCVEREDEAKRFVDHGNRMLLWHGTRLTNMVGILSHGLRVAPPEAPSTGYMFGKGIYFADMSSKSANYCYPTKTRNTGIVLLCEVSLGNTNDLLNADYDADKLPVGKHSVKGLGKQGPDPALNHICSDGLIVPLGKYKDTGVVNPAGYTLNYNEYIVYNARQVKMKYAVQIRFDFN